jgi:hypothetical protein
MKRKYVLFAALFAVSVVFLTAFICNCSANPFLPSGTFHGEPVSSSISVQSPSEKIIYWVGSDVWLDFTVTRPVTAWYDNNTNERIFSSVGEITRVTYSVDGALLQEAKKIGEYVGVGAYYSYSVNLGRLVSGQRTIGISAYGQGEYGTITPINDEIHATSNYTAEQKLVSSSVSITITVNAARPTTPPSITIINPKNQTYYSIMNWQSISYLRLEYKSDDTRLSVGYRLDDESNIIPITNGTKLNLTLQSRKLTLYANDSFGNSASPQTVYYEILPYVEPTHRPFPPPPNATISRYTMTPTLSQNTDSNYWVNLTALAAMASVIVIVAVASVSLVYFKKRKEKP